MSSDPNTAPGTDDGWAQKFSPRSGLEAAATTPPLKRGSTGSRQLSGYKANLPEGITWAMAGAGMKEWDAAVKGGERQWPRVLGRVFNAMKAAEGISDE